MFSLTQHITARASLSCRDIEEKALEAWATRDLRGQKNRWNTGKQKFTPRLAEMQLRAMFPSLTPAIIRRVLKDPNFCDLGKVRQPACASRVHLFLMAPLPAPGAGEAVLCMSG